MTITGLEYGRVARWTRPTTIYWFRFTSTSMAKIGMIQWARQHRTNGVQNPNSRMVSERNSMYVFYLEQTAGESQVTSTNCSMNTESAPGRVNRMQHRVSAKVGDPERAGAKRFGLESSARVGPVRPKPALQHLQRVHPKRLIPAADLRGPKRGRGRGGHAGIVGGKRATVGRG